MVSKLNVVHCPMFGVNCAHVCTEVLARVESVLEPVEVAAQWSDGLAVRNSHVGP